MIRKTAMVILYLPQQKNTCSMSATKTLETTIDNSNENIFKKTTDKFYKEIVMKNLAKFIGKHQCQSLFFSKVASLRPATLLKRDSRKDVFL